MSKSHRPIEVPHKNRSLTQQVWEVGLQRVMATAPSSQPDVEQALLLEYGRLCWPTTELSLSKQELEDLAGQISANASGATSETNWLRLSDILSQFAPRC